MPESLPGQQVARFNFVKFMGHLVGVFFFSASRPFLSIRNFSRGISFKQDIIDTGDNLLGVSLWRCFTINHNHLYHSCL